VNIHRILLTNDFDFSVRRDTWYITGNNPLGEPCDTLVDVMPHEQLALCESLCLSLAREHFPEAIDSVPALVDLAKDAIQDSSAGRPASIVSPTYGFGFDSEVASNALHIVGATVALVHLALAERHRRRDADIELRLQGIWQRLLTERGVDPDLAKAIPMKHLPEFLTLIDRMAGRLDGPT
jgi:hypothetical protein